MANEFTKSTKIKPAIIGTIADPDQYNQNIGGQSTGAIVCIDDDGEFVDGDIGDESLNSTGALINNIKLREGGALKIYNASGVLISSISFEQERGVISAFAMNTPPSGWLECTGAAISRGTYAALFALIGTTFGVGDGSTTFNIPDLRGYFVRGWANAGSIDSGRAFGSTQLDAFQGHYHTVVQQSQASSDSHSNNGAVASSFSGVANNNSTKATTIQGDGTNGTPRIATETRPINLAFMYCIKY